MLQVGQWDALDVLTKPRLLEIAASLGIGISGRVPKPEIVEAIASSAKAPFPRVLERLRRDELKAICQAAGIDDSGREKAQIADRLLGRRPDGGTNTLTKAELAEDVAAVTGVLKRDAEVLVNAVLETMTDTLQTGEKIEIRGFGSFRFRERGARVGRNPRTGVTVKVPAKRICYFKPGRLLLEMVNA